MLQICGKIHGAHTGLTAYISPLAPGSTKLQSLVRLGKINLGYWASSTWSMSQSLANTSLLRGSTGRAHALRRRSGSRSDPERVHDLAGSPLAALDTAVREALTERRGVLAGEMDRPLTDPREPPTTSIGSSDRTSAAAYALAIRRNCRVMRVKSWPRWITGSERHSRSVGRQAPSVRREHDRAPPGSPSAGDVRTR